MRQQVSQAALVGVGHSRVLRRDEVSLGVLAVEACSAAIEDAGLRPEDIDGITCIPDQPVEGLGTLDGVQMVTPNFVAQAMDLKVVWGDPTVGMVIDSVIYASHAVSAGACNYALVFRALHNPSGWRYGRTNPSTVSGNAQFTGSYGLFAPGGMAHLWTRYQAKYNSGTREQMGKFIVRNREMALKWPHGYWSQNRPEHLTLDDYMNARMISTPMCIYDCDIPVQGVGAYVITTAERARNLKNPPAYVWGTSAPPRGFNPSKKMGGIGTLEDGQVRLRIAADALWDHAGIRPDEVDVANVYDGFSPIIPFWMEAAGFCSEGEAFELMSSDETSLTGRLPLNTSSGNQGSGRVHGVAHIMDAALQVQGRSGERQVKNAEVSVALVGPPPNGAGIVFGKTPG